MDTSLALALTFFVLFLAGRILTNVHIVDVVLFQKGLKDDCVKCYVIAAMLFFGVLGTVGSLLWYAWAG